MGKRLNNKKNMCFARTANDGVGSPNACEEEKIQTTDKENRKWHN